MRETGSGAGAPEAAAVVMPRPAASVLLVRSSAPGAAEPLEVYMIRRNKGMKFLGGFYAFPGGRVDPADMTEDAFLRCHGLVPAAAAAVLDCDIVPPLAYWVTAIRELLEESGLLLACDADGRPVDATAPGASAAIDRAREGLMAGAPLAEVLAREGWYADVAGMRYLSHFVTPRTSPIRFSARFFLCGVPEGQAPRLFTEETSEGFWIHPGEGYRRFLADEMAMAEPAEYALGYLAQFRSLDDLWGAHVDNEHKFRGIVDRIDVFWKDFDWKQARWPSRRA